jgi:serine phosphatase RsbU (regulator of sigma subunit)
MSENGSGDQSNDVSQGTQLGFLVKARLKLSSFMLRRTPLWDQIQAFGRWLELDASLLASENNHSHILIELDDDAHVMAVRIGLKQSIDLSQYEQIWQFLSSLDLYAIRLDKRLEQNQVEDVFTFLYHYRHRIAKRRIPGGWHSGDGDLYSERGVHIACTQTCVLDKLLSMEYSYCTLGFSRVVHWLEKRNHHFRDHRVLFHAAPRYALIITGLVLTPGVVHALITGRFSFLLVLFGESILLYGLLYCFVMTVGSIEYDNEEKAYRLGLAYNQLKDYTTRIQIDIERSRSVQQRFLPPFASLPLQNRLEWATSFKPAEEVAGDYYDVAMLPDQRIVLLFCDVCGHGMAAAFITAVIKTTFQAWIDNPDGLEAIFNRINVNLLRLTPVESFAAVFVALFDPNTGQLDYMNGGHQPEPWRIPANGTQPIVSLCEARNLLLGIQEEPFAQSASIHLNRGDTLLFVSDGIIENRNEDGELYGSEQFESLLESCRGQGVGDLVRRIEKEVVRYGRGLPQSDDQTVLGLSIR